MRRAVRYGERAAQWDPKRSSVIKLLFSPMVTFLKQYVLKRGFLDGYLGFLMCVGVTYGTGIKHFLKLATDYHKDTEGCGGTV